MAPSISSAHVVPEELTKCDVALVSPSTVADSERELVQKMRDALRASGVEADDVRDFDLARFLRAKGLSVSRAVKMYVDDIKWRQDYFGTEGIRVSELEGEMKANKSYLVAKEGYQPWVYMLARNHDSTTRDLQTFNRFCVFVLERAMDRFPSGVEQFGCVLDLADAQYKNLDARGILLLLDTVAAHYPERLHQLYVIHVPYIFWGVWKMVKPLVDSRIRQKIVFVEDSNIAEVLSSNIPAAVLPKEYGGEAELKGHWETFGTRC